MYIVAEAMVTVARYPKDNCCVCPNAILLAGASDKLGSSSYN